MVFVLLFFPEAKGKSLEEMQLSTSRREALLHADARLSQSPKNLLLILLNFIEITFFR